MPSAAFQDLDGIDADLASDDGRSDWETCSTSSTDDVDKYDDTLLSPTRRQRGPFMDPHHLDLAMHPHDTWLPAVNSPTQHKVEVEVHTFQLRRDDGSSDCGRIEAWLVQDTPSQSFPAGLDLDYFAPRIQDLGEVSELYEEDGWAHPSEDGL